MTTGNAEGPPALDWRHAPAEIPGRGLAVTRTATSDECDRVAQALGILKVVSLAVDYRLVVSGRRRDVGGDRMTSVSFAGTLTADVQQECVATLAAVPEHISESFDVEFVPSEDLTALLGDDLLEGPDLEPLEANGSLAVGRVVYEILGTALDPAPRAPGADIIWTEGDTREVKPSPFAALAKLKGRPPPPEGEP